MLSRIPLFFHVPKSSGTFVYASLLSGARLFRRKHRLVGVVPGVETIRSILLMSEGAIQARMIVFDQRHNLDALGDGCKRDDCSWEVELEKFSCSLLEGLVVLGVFIEPEGFRTADDILRLISCNLKADFYKFIIVREPYDRERSLYYYLMSDSSRHEPTHGRISGESFEGYLSSFRVSDSWLIRNLLDLGDSVILTEEHFGLACDKIYGFKVYDIARADIAVEEVLRDCFGVEAAESKAKFMQPRNNTIHPLTKIDDLPLEVQEKFLRRAYWDRKFYQEAIR